MVNEISNASGDSLTSILKDIALVLRAVCEGVHGWVGCYYKMHPLRLGLMAFNPCHTWSHSFIRSTCDQYRTI